MGCVALEPEDREACLLLLGLDPRREYDLEELQSARDAKLDANIADLSGSTSYEDAIKEVFESLVSGRGSKSVVREELRDGAASAQACSLGGHTCALPLESLSVAGPVDVGCEGGPRLARFAHAPPPDSPLRRSLVAPTLFWSLCIVVADLVLRSDHDHAALYGLGIGLIALGIGGVSRYVAVHGARRVTTWLGVVGLVALGLGTVAAAYFLASLPSMIGEAVHVSAKGRASRLLQQSL
jgi:hypothetical protein